MPSNAVMFFSACWSPWQKNPWHMEKYPGWLSCDSRLCLEGVRGPWDMGHERCELWIHDFLQEHRKCSPCWTVLMQRWYRGWVTHADYSKLLIGVAPMQMPWSCYRLATNIQLEPAGILLVRNISSSCANLVHFWLSSLSSVCSASIGYNLSIITVGFANCNTVSPSLVLHLQSPHPEEFKLSGRGHAMRWVQVWYTGARSLSKSLNRVATGCDPLSIELSWWCLISKV
jgi:hypothetical protein